MKKLFLPFMQKQKNFLAFMQKTKKPGNGNKSYCMSDKTVIRKLGFTYLRKLICLQC